MAQFSLVVSFVLPTPLRYAVKRCAQLVVFLDERVNVAFLLIYFPLQKLNILLVNVSVFLEQLTLLQGLFLLLLCFAQLNFQLL